MNHYSHMLPDLTLKNFKHVGTLLAEKEYV